MQGKVVNFIHRFIIYALTVHLFIYDFTMIMFCNVQVIVSEAFCNIIVSKGGQTFEKRSETDPDLTVS